MENIVQIKLSLTIKKGYIVTYKGTLENRNLSSITKLIKKAQK